MHFEYIQIYLNPQNFLGISDMIRYWVSSNIKNKTCSWISCCEFQIFFRIFCCCCLQVLLSFLLSLNFKWGEFYKCYKLASKNLILRWEAKLAPRSLLQHVSQFFPQNRCLLKKLHCFQSNCLSIIIRRPWPCIYWNTVCLTNLSQFNLQSSTVDMNNYCMQE